MKAREYFRRVLIAEKELKILNAKLRHYEDIGLSMSINTSGMPGNAHRGASRVEMAAIGAVDVFRELYDKQREFQAIIARAEQVIRGIQQERYRQILQYRYLCGWSFRSISDELGYKDENSVYRAHGWALHEAQIILNRMEEQNNVQSASAGQDKDRS